MLLCFLFAIGSGYAQEVDKSKTNKKKLRETRFKIRNKQGDKVRKGDITGRKQKVRRTKNKSKISTPSRNPYDNNVYQYKERRSEGKNVTPSGGYFNTPSRSSEPKRTGDISGRKIRKSVTKTGEGKAVSPQANPYARQKQRSEAQKAKISRGYGGGFQSITQSGEDKPKKRRRIQPRTASRAFIRKGKVNAYAGRARHGERAHTKDIAGRKIRTKNFKSKTRPVVRPSFNPYFARKRRGDEYHKALPNTGYGTASKKGEVKYKGLAAGGYESATKRGENAWKKDITGRKFKSPADPGIVTGKKGRTYTGARDRVLSISGGLKNNGGRSTNDSGGGGSVSGRIWRSKGKIAALPRRDFSTPSTTGFAGNIKGARKPLKGGGSISNQIWKGKGQALPRRDFSQPQIGGFAGNVKGARKPLKGGGSISNQIWRGKGQSLQRRDLSQPGVSGFAGNIKGARKSLKGGGSISKSGWNNNGNALPKNDDFERGMSFFQGNIKGARKPLKGGGSISRSGWNNNGNALPKNDDFERGMSFFQGNIKRSRKPLKGGGSISGKRWNNGGNPLIQKYGQNKATSNFTGRFKRFEISPGYATDDIGNYKGRFKRHELIPIYTSDDFGNYKGRFKVKRRYIHNPQSAKEALKVKDLGESKYYHPGIASFQGHIKDKRNFKKKPNAHEDALPGLAPKKAVANLDSYIPKYIKVRYTKKPNAHENALKGIAPKKAVVKLDSYVPKYAKVKYSKKPNAHEDALRGRAPKKAVAKLHSYVPKYTKVKYTKKPNAHEDALKGIAPTNSASKAIAYQGNFKVKKTYKKGMHPSAKYTTSVKPRNSLKEKEQTFKFNIWWAKLFKKNENQPTAVKEKIRTPRYDKREKDLWYD